jgi:hypothetical protein
MQRHLKLFTTHVERRHESELRKFVCRDFAKIMSIVETANDEDRSTELTLTLSILGTLMLHYQGNLSWENTNQIEDKVFVKNSPVKWLFQMLQLTYVIKAYLKCHYF